MSWIPNGALKQGSNVVHGFTQCQLSVCDTPPSLPKVFDEGLPKGGLSALAALSPVEVKILKLLILFFVFCIASCIMT